MSIFKEEEMKKTVYLSTLLVGTILSMPAFADSGTCGDGCSWDLTNGKLTISGTGSMTEYQSNAEVPWASVASTITNVEIKNGITNIGNRAFNGATSLTSISIPDSVTSIGIAAFQNASSLEHVTIPDTVQSIGDGAFNKASSLKSVNIPEGVTSLGRQAFYQTSLESIDLPSTLTSIGQSAFAYTHLTEVVVPEGVTEMGKAVFNNVETLKSVVLPDTLTTLSDGMFNNNTSLESVKLPKDLTSIGGWAFYGAALENVDIPDGVQSIGTAAFYGNTNLKEVDLPSNLISIGDGAFQGDYALTSIDLPDGLETIGIGAFTSTSLGSIIIPDSVTKIGADAFNQAYGYKDVTNRIDTIILSENLEELGTKAFVRSTATSIVLPESLFADGRELNPYAFEYSGITKIYCPEGNQKCLSYVPMFCLGDHVDDDDTCDADSRPLVENLKVETYKITADGQYILNGRKYASFADMQKKSGRELKRIYSIDEAEKASKDTGNTIRIRYR